MNQKNSMASRLFFLAFAIFINGLGNALTVSMNLGSALWTASAVNISNFFSWNLGTTLFGTALFAAVLTVILLRKFKWKQVLGNIIFMVLFSLVVNYLTSLLMMTPLPELPYIIKLIIDLIGIVFIGCGISLYQRVNLIMHPVDDLMKVIRFNYTKGNPVSAQLLTFTPPIIVIIIIFAVSQQLSAVNIGTIFALFFQGKIVDLADKFLFPNFKYDKMD
ncbi:hypothetical protein R4Y45_01090 [Holzapfeliella sp. He02]|uniref:Sugar specific permease (Putative) n=1 Tax=Holzapfeliella saturejae TaxID=3082953 RepID=A0ABU8SFX6_9LACO